jgi:hypothetical protein
MIWSCGRYPGFFLLLVGFEIVVNRHEVFVVVTLAGFVPSRLSHPHSATWTPVVDEGSSIQRLSSCHSVSENDE